MNELFTAWVETVNHRRVHSETGQTPLARFTTAVPPMLPTPAALHEAFLWSEHRLVAKTATVSLHGNTYEVDAALVGRRVELVFDPFDLTELQVRYQGRDMGAAAGHLIGRHVHPAAKPETSPDPAPPTGIDYLALVRDRHTATLTVPPVRYTDAGGHTTKTVDIVDCGVDRLDVGLEAELAAFATLA
jgi:putative transposase